MKLFALTALGSLFIHPFSFAEKITAPPPRTAQMETTYSSGFYGPVRGGSLTMHFDDQGTPAALTVTVAGRVLTAQVLETHLGRCGNRVLARMHYRDLNTGTTVELTDFTGARCRMFVKNKWHADVTTIEHDGSVSEIRFEGTPET